ncbi:MAG: hypothetical protein ACJ74U_08805 [Jatrophihabitantaceae bacterium]
MPDIVRFPEFRDQILDDLKSTHSGAEVRADESEATVASDSGHHVVSIDKLYRTYVDLALQSPDSSHEDLVAAAKNGVNNWKTVSGESPVFTVDRIPTHLSNLMLMQKCVATGPA